MTNRRDIMKGGVAVATVAAVPFAARTARAGAETPRDAAPLLAAIPAPAIAVGDRALPSTTTFLAAAAARAFVARHFRSDAGALWMHVLEPRLRAGPLSMVGLTSAATLFCLETLALDYGARVVARLDARSPALDTQRDFDLALDALAAADPARAIPAFDLAPQASARAVLWRVETHGSFRSILRPRDALAARVSDLSLETKG